MYEVSECPMSQNVRSLRMYKVSVKSQNVQSLRMYAVSESMQSQNLLTPWCQSVDVSKQLALGHSRVSHQANVDVSYGRKTNLRNMSAIISVTPERFLKLVFQRIVRYILESRSGNSIIVVKLHYP